MKKILIFLLMAVGVVFSVVFGGFFDKSALAESVINENLPEIFIKAINPGYTVDGVANVGEMIEIGRNSDHLESLAGLKIGYINSSGNETILVDLSKYLWSAGESILLRLASSPGAELAHIQYAKTLAFKAGPLLIRRGDEIIDTVCWTGGEGCVAAFNSSRPTTLVRNLLTGGFEHLSDYTPLFMEGNLSVVEESGSEDSDGGDAVVQSKCKGVVFSEILSYYETLQSEQFIEFFNTGHESVNLEGCAVRYKNKKYPLSGMVGPEGYFVRYLTDFRLTKNPTTSNVVELLDANGEVLDKLEYFNGQRKGTSYAFIGYDEAGGEIWKTTYAPTPGEPNNYQEFRTCEAGKVINEATGNCVKVTSLAEKICGEGKYLNILTGRCKSNESSSSGSKECKEGYYYNEETKRCRKIKENDGADYALVPETFNEENSFVALYLVLGVLGVGVVYIIYEFRHDIMRIFRRVMRR
ncbi:lamin tail domain-containing protein [Candidatus Saccharibacteria bacterium]|nr:lamin tail domain-containing protein [Candidatus Saccharibacteria bacterium]